MVERTIYDLTRDLAERRRLGEPAPVVLLGAGASAEAGIGTMGALFAFMHVRDREEFAARIAEITDNERYRLLAEFLQTQDPLEVTAGYRALAALCEAAYFDIVLTTNFDPLLDDALVASGMLAARLSPPHQRRAARRSPAGADRLTQPAGQGAQAAR